MRGVAMRIFATNPGIELFVDTALFHLSAQKIVPQNACTFGQLAIERVWLGDVASNRVANVGHSSVPPFVSSSDARKESRPPRQEPPSISHQDQPLPEIDTMQWIYGALRKWFRSESDSARLQKAPH